MLRGFPVIMIGNTVYPSRNQKKTLLGLFPIPVLPLASVAAVAWFPFRGTEIALGREHLRGMVEKRNVTSQNMLCPIIISKGETAISHCNSQIQSDLLNLKRTSFIMT